MQSGKPAALVLKGVLCASALAMLPSLATAGLAARPLGMVYDEEQDITWMPLPFYPTRDWFDAMAYADSLDYGGITTWRLPTTDPFDSTCSYRNDTNGGSWGFGCKGSELGYLYHVQLGIPAAGFAYQADPQAAAFFPGLAQFGWAYWSSTEFEGNSMWAFSLNFNGGLQAHPDKWTRSWIAAWAVADGDVAAVPEPSAAGLLALGLCGVLARRRLRGGKPA